MSDNTTVLIDVYRDVNTPTDGLPYTDQFEELCRKFRDRTGRSIERGELWQQLCKLRKKGQLPRLRR